MLVVKARARSRVRGGHAVGVLTWMPRGRRATEVVVWERHWCLKKCRTGSHLRNRSIKVDERKAGGAKAVLDGPGEALQGNEVSSLACTFYSRRRPDNAETEQSVGRAGA